MDIISVIQLGINGLLLGSFYATMALGFSTIWGVMRLINLAHGEFLLLAAYVAWFFFNPEREQYLSVAILEDEGATTIAIIALAAVCAILGLVIGEWVIGGKRIPNTIARRGISLVSGLVIAVIGFNVWQANEFPPISVPVMLLVGVGLALSLGFIMSHIVFGMIQRIPATRSRHAMGFIIGGGVTLILYWLWEAQNFTPIDPFLALPLVFILFLGMGYVLQKYFYNQLVESSHLTMLLVTFGVAIVLQNLMLQIYAADPRRINSNYGNAIFLVEDRLSISPTRILVLIVFVVMVVAMIAFLRYTRTGYAIRAAAQNKMAARLMGINIHEVYALTFAISLGLTGIAGAMMGTFQPITPVTGATWTLRAFAIVALGGLGKVEGVVVGGIVLGLTESFLSGIIGVGWAIAAAFGLLVLMLIFRPQGLTGGLVVAEE